MRYSTEAAQWKEESLKLKKDLKASSSTNSSAEKERDQLSKDMDKLKQKMEALDGKYKQATQTNCGLEADKVAADRELKQLRKQNADLERNMEKLKATDNKGKETSVALAQLTKTYDAFMKTHDTLTKASEKLKLDLDAKNAELMKEIEVNVQLDRELAEAKNELEARAASIETLTRDKNEEMRLKKETDQVLLITVGKLDDAQRKLTEVEGKVQTMTEV
jgi:chromosome segregation ATPase